MRELREIRIRFERDGDLEVSVTYSHQDQIANPGTKTRTTAAARMARAGLERALRELDRGTALWGGFGTNTAVSTDLLLVESKPREDAA